MNIKNKILLTIIAIIFAICLFNTNCFATIDYKLNDDVTLSIPDEWLDYYYYVFINEIDTGGYSLKIFLSTTPITFQSNVINDKPAGIIYTEDGNDLLSGFEVNIPNVIQSSVDEALSHITLDGSTSLKSGTGHWYLSDENLFFITSNTNITSVDGDIIFESVQRGTEEDNIVPGDTTDNTSGGSSTDIGNTTDSDDSGGILSSITQGFENVVNFFKELLTNLRNLLSSIGGWFSELFTKLGGWFSNLTNSIGDFFTNLGTSISGFFTNLWTNIRDFFSGIPNFFSNFWDDLKKIFIPNQNSFTGIKDIVESKFDFIDSIKIAANSMKDLISNVGAAPKLTINVNNNDYGVKKVTLIDLEWYKPYKTYGDLILTGFIYAFFLWRLFITIPNIIHGFGGAVQDSYKITEIKGGKD